MGSLLKLALSALAASSQNSALTAFSGRMAASGVLAVVAILLAGVAWGCACAALWIGVAPTLGPVGAPLVVAGVCLTVARAVNHLLLDAVLADAGKLIQEHKIEAILAAIIAGFVAGNNGRKS